MKTKLWIIVCALVLVACSQSSEHASNKKADSKKMIVMIPSIIELFHSCRVILKFYIV